MTLSVLWLSKASTCFQPLLVNVFYFNSFLQGLDFILTQCFVWKVPPGAPLDSASGIPLGTPCPAPGLSQPGFPGPCLPGLATLCLELGVRSYTSQFLIYGPLPQWSVDFGFLGSTRAVVATLTFICFPGSQVTQERQALSCTQKARLLKRRKLPWLGASPVLLSSVVPRMGSQ